MTDINRRKASMTFEPFSLTPEPLLTDQFQRSNS